MRLEPRWPEDAVAPRSQRDDAHWRPSRRSRQRNFPFCLLQDEAFVTLCHYFCALGPIGGGGVRVKKKCARFSFNIPANKPSVGAAQERAAAYLVGVCHPRILRLQCGCYA